MASLPSLVVNLALDSATFVSGLTKAEYQAKKSADAIKESIDNIGDVVEKVAALIGVGLGIDAFKDMVKGAIEAEAQLQLLGDRAGLTGAQLSAFIGVAARSKTDLETVVQASVKLSKALLDFSNEGAKSTLVLKALGVSAKDIPGLLAAPDQALISIAKTLDQLPAGGTKAAANLLILGRGGSQAAAFLSELAKTQELVQTRTQEQIDSAKELADRFIDLGVKTDTLKSIFANALVQPLNAVLDAFVKLTTGTNDTKAGLEQLAKDGSIAAWAKDAAVAVGTVAEALIFVGKTAVAVGASFKAVYADAKVLLYEAQEQVNGGGLIGTLPAFRSDEYKKAIADRDAAVSDADKKHADLITYDGNFIVKAIEKSFSLQAAATKAGLDAQVNADQNDRRAASINSAKSVADAAAKAKAAKAVQDAIDAKNRGTDHDDPAKALLEGQLKAQENAIAEQRDLLKTQQEFLKAYYDQDLITLQQYYDGEKAARQAALTVTVNAYDAEIAAAEAYQKHEAALGSKRGVQDAQNKIDDVTAKRLKAINDEKNAEELLALQRTKDFQKYSDELEQLHAQTLALNGSTVQAASLSFQIQNRHGIAQANLTGNTQAQADFAFQQQQIIVQAGLNDVTKQYDTILGSVAVQQGYINLAQSTGRISQIEALQKQSELNKAIIPDLEKIADIYAQIAAQSSNPADLIKAQQMKLAVEQLKTQTDLLADSFNKTFGDAFASALSDVVTGAKSAKQAVQDFAKSITKSIADLASQDIASKLFGQGGALSGAGDLLSKLFGGSTSGSGAAGIATLGSASAATATSMTLVATAAASAAAALSAVGVASAFSGGAGSIASLFADSGGISSSLGSQFLGGLPFLAGGTDSFGGGMAVVGENGPEILNIPRGAQVIPNSVLMQKRAERSVNITQHINVMPGASTQSARQSAAQIREAVTRSAKDR